MDKLKIYVWRACRAEAKTAELKRAIADAIAILDQAGDNRDEALARLREVERG